MAVAQGYGKTVTSGSVFAYDVADFRNSFKGKPTTNLLTTIDKAGTNDSTYFKTNSGTEVKYVPNVGVRTVHYVNILNDYGGGSGNCCPAPMSFGEFTVSPSTQYTYQIIYKTTTGYSHPNYMYHYEYNGGTYITEYGLHDTGRIQDLGDGWRHAWGTFTSNASANRFITYLFHYEYGIQNKIEVAGVMLTQGNNIIPPRQFLDVNTTRSGTQGLLPLVGNSTLDLSNVSFDSNAQIVFDGTNDTISAPSNSSNNISGNITLEIILNRNTGNQGVVIHKEVQYTIIVGSNGSISYADSSLWSYSSFGNHGTILPNQNNHLVVTKNGSLVTIYLNGNVVVSQNFGGTISQTNNTLHIGSYDGISNFFSGQIPVSKIYNRALSAAEVRQNYLHYKTRFNLS
jgi:hypothetical protein